MIKAFIKYLLFLCIFLLSGYNHLSAHTYEENTFNSTAKGTEYTSFDAFQQDPAFISKSSSSGAEKNFTIEVTEIEIEEEDEWISFKKYVENSNYFTTFFYTHLSKYFSQSIKTRLSFCKHFSHFSSLESLYLIFRVLRL